MFLFSKILKKKTVLLISRNVDFFILPFTMQCCYQDVFMAVEVLVKRAEYFWIVFLNTGFVWYYNIDLVWSFQVMSISKQVLLFNTLNFWCTNFQITEKGKSSIGNTMVFARANFFIYENALLKHSSHV